QRPEVSPGPAGIHRGHRPGEIRLVQVAQTRWPPVLGPGNQEHPYPNPATALNDPMSGANVMNSKKQTQTVTPAPAQTISVRIFGVGSGGVAMLETMMEGEFTGASF